MGGEVMTRVTTAVSDLQAVGRILQKKLNKNGAGPNDTDRKNVEVCAEVLEKCRDAVGLTDEETRELENAELLLRRMRAAVR